MTIPCATLTVNCLSSTKYKQDDVDHTLMTTVVAGAFGAQTDKLTVSGEIDGERDSDKRKLAWLGCSKRVCIEKTKLRHGVDDLRVSAEKAIEKTEAIITDHKADPHFVPYPFFVTRCGLPRKWYRLCVCCFAMDSDAA